MSQGRTSLSIMPDCSMEPGNVRCGSRDLFPGTHPVRLCGRRGSAAAGAAAILPAWRSRRSAPSRAPEARCPLHAGSPESPARQTRIGRRRGAGRRACLCWLLELVIVGAQRLRAHGLVQRRGDLVPRPAVRRVREDSGHRLRRRIGIKPRRDARSIRRRGSRPHSGRRSRGSGHQAPAGTPSTGRGGDTNG